MKCRRLFIYCSHNVIFKKDDVYFHIELYKTFKANSLTMRSANLSFYLGYIGGWFLAR